jgi:hypothetical protein
MEVKRIEEAKTLPTLETETSPTPVLESTGFAMVYNEFISVWSVGSMAG